MVIGCYVKQKYLLIFEYNSGKNIYVKNRCFSDLIREYVTLGFGTNCNAFVTSHKREEKRKTRRNDKEHVQLQYIQYIKS